ncbi:mRNA cap guanine-N7 methyltransferase 1 [Porphyridium purpureum]|uniref:mRNA (guanine-N(7))-methyltransferase n=1 Tax=Porphyridium purpureum TaxID=35688 RepID=A0A5J4Z4C6_PORPP|nr:mRNA cap guanine-N7 methyltransferase 1 [Porphyridium purpureum]KAA8497823.1 mRNA cap guanine-N7 methyltransferase 1 [Porphyridium purpureum]|eukprot:POR3312..scf222_8
MAQVGSVETRVLVAMGDNERVAEHYNRVEQRGLRERRESRIIRLRKFNNWVKDVLIQQYSRPGYTVLDFACGKGGDLLKWQRAMALHYVGCDTALVSLQQAVGRYSEITGPKFTCSLLWGDCFAVDLDSYLEPGLTFDLVSCQFAIHYAFENEARVRQMLTNATARLKKGGYFLGTTTDSNVLLRKLYAVQHLTFGNPVYAVRFTDENARKCFRKDQPFGHKYFFTLDEQVEDCPEFVVHMPAFARIAEEYGLKLIEAKNLHQFWVDQQTVDASMKSFERNKVLGHDRSFPCDEWDAIYLYTTFVFQKTGDMAPLGLGAVDALQRLSDLNEDKLRLEPSQIIRMTVQGSMTVDDTVDSVPQVNAMSDSRDSPESPDSSSRP